MGVAHQIACYSHGESAYCYYYCLYVTLLLWKDNGQPNPRLPYHQCRSPSTGSGCCCKAHLHHMERKQHEKGLCYPIAAAAAEVLATCGEEESAKWHQGGRGQGFVFWGRERVEWGGMVLEGGGPNGSFFHQILTPFKGLLSA